MLQFSDIKLELLTDPEILLYIERGITGSVSPCCNRYAKGNNPYMGLYYNPLEENAYLFYFDTIDNQYGAAMSEFLPNRNFK